VAPDTPQWVKFLLDHRAKPFGFARGFEDRGDALYAVLEVPREELSDPEVAAAMRQMANGVRDAVSVGVVINEADETPQEDSRWKVHYRATRAELLEISSVVIPRFPNARIGGLAATSQLEGQAMTPEQIEAERRRRMAAGGPDDDVDEDQADVDEDQTDEETARADAHRRATTRASRHTARPATAPRHRFASFGHYACAVYDGQVEAVERRRIDFALTDITSQDIPGIMPPQWVKDFAELLDDGRPVIEAFETRPLPETGMQINYPVKVITPPMVGQQAAEKTEVESGGFQINLASSNVITWAGADDVAIQAIERSEPDLLSLYLEELGYQMALESDGDFTAAMLAAIAAGNEVPMARTVADINTTLAHAARLVFQARRGARPQVMVAGLDVWEFLVGATDTDGRPLFPNLNGANPVGQLSFTDLNGEARGLTVVCTPNMPDDKAVMGWRRAATTWLGPVRTLSADKPANLGRDVAIYQFGTWAVRRPDALVELTLAAAAPAAARSTTKKAAE
jgi:hypothetical protein